MKTLIVHHHPCWDGSAAAWAVWKCLANKEGDDTGFDFHPAKYGDDPPNVSGYDRVYIVDFSYDRETLCALHDEVMSGNEDGDFLVLDHHKTAQDNLEGLDFCQFDMSKSGARLAWEHFSDEEIPWFLKLIEDRDLWKWEFPDTKPFTAYLKTETPSVSFMENMEYGSGGFYDQAVAKGETLLEYQNHLAERIANHARPVKYVRKNGDITKIYTVNAQVLASEVGHVLCEEHGTGATYYQTRDGGIKFCLRAEVSTDLSGLAADFGGGGHPTACGFYLPRNAADMIFDVDIVDSRKL